MENVASQGHKQPVNPSGEKRFYLLQDPRRAFVCGAWIHGDGETKRHPVHEGVFRKLRIRALA